MEEGTTPCCICFLPDEGGENNSNTTQWSCSVCNSKCHMTCIRNWAQSNHNRHRSTFSCPICRQNFSLSSLPGTPIVPLSIPSSPFDSVRPGLTSFIATVLRSTQNNAQEQGHGQEPIEDEFEARDTNPPQSYTYTTSIPPIRRTEVSSRNSSQNQEQTPVAIINGTGPIRVERLTIINHF